MKRKAENAEETILKRIHGVKGLSEETTVTSVTHQNATNMKSVEYLNVLLKLKGRLESIVQMKDMAKAMKEMESKDQTSINLHEESDEEFLSMPEEISEDEWSNGEQEHEKEDSDKDTDEDVDEETDDDS